MGFLVPIFVGIAEAVIGAGAVATTLGYVAAFATEAFLLTGISRLLTKNAAGTGQGDSGARTQLPPQTNNVLPVVYGSAFVSPTITDAKISSDQTTMWYVCALSEVTNTNSVLDTPDTFTFGNIYYDNKLVTFGAGAGGGNNNVISLTTNSVPNQVDTKMKDKLYMYLFPNGSYSGINTGGRSAIDILSDAAIPAGERWDGPIYNTGGQSPNMTNTAFVILKIVYDVNAGTTNLGTLTVQLQNSRNKPGDVFTDYFHNTRYGCGIPAEQIDYYSFAQLNDYSDQDISYTPAGGGTAVQPRYRFNGPIDTGQNCLHNLQLMADSCDSWVSYNEITGRWQVVVNRSYLDVNPIAATDLVVGKEYTISSLGSTDWNYIAGTSTISYQPGETITVLNAGTGSGTAVQAPFQVTDYNLVSGITVNPVSLDQIYNLLEVQYPDANIKDQTDYSYIDLRVSLPEVMSYNEPKNLLTVQLPITNNYVTATYIGERRLLASRDGLSITFNLDYSGIQLTAGDVIAIPFAPYGWNTLNYNYGKLFRIMQVQEIKDGAGSLGISVSATEYNDTIYANNPIQEYVPDQNTGLSQTSVLGTPDPPVATLTTANTVAAMHVLGTVPTYSADTPGQVMFMDFNYGYSNISSDHKLYTTVSNSNGQPLINGSTLSINCTDVPSGNVYWSVSARNKLVAVRGPSTETPIQWTGPAVTTNASNVHCGASSSGNSITFSTPFDSTYYESLKLSVAQGSKIQVTMASGTGNILANTFISTVVSNTQVYLYQAPDVALVNACVNFEQGGVGYTNLNSTTTAGQQIGFVNYGVTYGGSLHLPVAVSNTAINQPVYITGTAVTANRIYPYYQGTSSTTIGYVATSIAPFIPIGAAELRIQNGNFNWYTVAESNGWPQANIVVNAYEITNQATYLQVVANANTKVQVVPFQKYQSNTDLIFADTTQLSTYELVANEPFIIYQQSSLFGTEQEYGQGLLMRNMVANTKVTIADCTFSVTKNKTSAQRPPPAPPVTNADTAVNMLEVLTNNASNAHAALNMIEVLTSY